MSMWQVTICAMARRRRWTILLILIALLETGTAMVLCMLTARQEATMEKKVWKSKDPTKMIFENVVTCFCN